MRRKLNIKSLTPRKDAPYRQGYYHLINPSKYLGDPSKIIFRSSYEKRFATYCDVNDRVICWSSEPMEIPYLHPIDRVVKPYNVDFYVKIRRDDGTTSEFIVEVKPERQLHQPNSPDKRITEKAMIKYTEAMKTYLINVAKFSAARAFAKSRGWEFVIVTESFIF